MNIYICLNTIVLSEQSSTLHSSTSVQSTMEGMNVSVCKLAPMNFNETWHTHAVCHYIATQTPADLSGISLPVIIISITLNILLISALVLIIIVLITCRKNSGRVCYAYIFVQRYCRIKIHMLIM